MTDKRQIITESFQKSNIKVQVSETPKPKTAPPPQSPKFTEKNPKKS